ncbi:hypothetical protein NS506_05260 [Nocardia seriolae]|uniref:Uncharacterized protein n=1 Tax=Nocardia seriolae TaxID=37332 RepID=A0ABC8AZ61_9NOCA|nr:hypothetical protein NS506_05260 [Nocardia seriolae]
MNQDYTGSAVLDAGSSSIRDLLFSVVSTFSGNMR